MKPKLDRRELLKLTGLASASSMLPFLFSGPTVKKQQNGDEQNVLIIVFDAWSARHMSLYGFPRQTTPNIDRLA